MKAFHDHLDTCPVCANQPFGLCPVGLKLLLAAAVPTLTTCPKCRGTGYFDYESGGQVQSEPCPDCQPTIEHDVKETEQKEQPCKTQST